MNEYGTRRRKWRKMPSPFFTVVTGQLNGTVSHTVMNLTRRSSVIFISSEMLRTTVHIFIWILSTFYFRGVPKSQNRHCLSEPWMMPRQPCMCQMSGLPIYHIMALTKRKKCGMKPKKNKIRTTDNAVIAVSLRSDTPSPHIGNIENTVGGCYRIR